MLLKLALSNILLNRRRTIITIALSAFSAAFFIFYIGLLKGSFTKMYKDQSELYLGYIQVTGAGYLDDPSNENLIFNEKEVLSKIKQNPDVEFVSSRFESFALYASSENAFGAQFTAVQPSLEQKMTNMSKHIYKGRYLQDDDTTGIVLGSGLAKRLEVDVGGKLSVITTAADYSFAAENLYVVGILKTHVPELDNNLVFMNKGHFDTFMESENIATHIIAKPKDTKKSLSITSDLNKTLDDSSLHIEDWHTFMSHMIQLEQMKIQGGATTISLFILLIFFVVLIYTFLAVQSRIKEIGIMRAIGTKPSQILRVLLYETFILAVVSVIIGGIVGGYLTYYFNINPIYLSSVEEMYREYGILDAHLPTEFEWNYVFIGTAYVFVLNLISIIYPAWTVIRIRPIDAINHI